MTRHDGFVSLLSLPSNVPLNDWFVAPPDFERILGENSVIVFGGAGTGKTTLSQSLSYFGNGGKEAGKRLIVRWKPTLFAMESDSMSSASRLIDQALDACTLEISAFLAANPEIFKSIPDWAQDVVCWFIQKNLRGNLSARLGPIFDEVEQAKLILDRLLSKKVDDLLYNPDPLQKISELLPALKRLRLDGIWLCMDGLEGWVDAKQEQLVKDLTAFLSVLNIFEQPGLAFKLFLPSDLEPYIIRASGVARRRVDGCTLRWNVHRLQELVEKRLVLASGKKQLSIQTLCNSPSLSAWLDRVGGDSPREWLDQIEPLFSYYMSQELSKPINDKTWKNLRLDHPPHFSMDEATLKVKVGGREIRLDDVPPNAFKILRYLYEHNGQVVEKAELYYKIYSGLKSVPKSIGEEGYESPKEYVGVIDTSLYRLRQAIEPDPKHPVIIQTVRGHGVKLVSRW